MHKPAVADTDTNNLIGVYEISDSLSKNGIQPFVCVSLSVDFDAGGSPHQGQQVKSYPSVALLVKDGAGYVQLSKLLSSAYLEAGPGELPHASAERLLSHAPGLLLLTGGLFGLVFWFFVVG